MKHPGLFITGTDTGVGKTWVATRLISELRRQGHNAVGMKPVECGEREDSEALLRASGGHLPLDGINPISLSEPLAPAAIAGAPKIETDLILARYHVLAESHRPVIVEGAGGWLVPLDRERTMADIAIALALPVVVVARNRLGVLNHTLLTVRAILDSGLECLAVFLNDHPSDAAELSRSSNAEVLRDCLDGIPVIDAVGELIVDS